MTTTTIIAECGINHAGDLRHAIELCGEAKRAGADAVKFQLFTKQARPKGEKYIFQLGDWIQIMNAGEAADIPVFFSVFDFESVKRAKNLGAKWVKLSFVERRNSRLIAACNEAGFERKFVSVDAWGQYSQTELDGWEKLYCANNGWSGYYPTKCTDIEWERVAELFLRDGVLAGWSDHCQGWTEAVQMVALGARIVEKHFKIDDDCPDAECSLSPCDFKLMVAAIRWIDDNLMELMDFGGRLCCTSST